MGHERLLQTTAFLFIASLATAQVQNYSVGETVDDFTVTDTDGNVHNLYTYTAQGKHIVLDFFFDTCPPCQQTQPIYNQLHETYGCNSHDLITLSINNGSDSNAEVDAFEDTYGGTYAHAPVVGMQGGCAAVDEAFGITAYPTYCLIGPDNKLKVVDIWPIADMQSFVNAFPVGSGISTASCAVGIAEHDHGMVDALFPSPSNGSVTMRYTLAKAGHVALDVMDALGRTVHTNVLGERPSGAFVHTLDLGHLPDGNYMVRLSLDQVPSGTARLAIVR